jgi:rRNA maturation protein Nop10
MKVVKSGNWNDKWTGETTCTTCGAVLALEEADVEPVHYRINGGYDCLCPECGKRTKVDGHDFPRRFSEALNARRKYCGSGDPW